jgi:hypothetical protein
MRCANGSLPSGRPDDGLGRLAGVPYPSVTECPGVRVMQGCEPSSRPGAAFARYQRQPWSRRSSSSSVSGRSSLPGGADMLDGVDRIALLAVRLVARVGIFDIVVIARSVAAFGDGLAAPLPTMRPR